MDEPARPRYRLLIESLASSVPNVIRLRQWLKVGLRAFRFKVVSLEEVKEIQHGEDSEQSQ